MGSTVSWQDIFNQATGGMGGAPGGSSQQAPSFDFSKKKDGTPRKPFSKKAWIVFIVVLLLVVAGAYWWFHPSLNIHSSSLWVFVCVFICLPLTVVFGVQSSVNKHRGERDVKYQKKAKTYKRLAWIPVAIIALGLLGSLLSATFFPGNASKYASILETDEYDFASDMEEVDYNSIPVIDRNSAVILGNRAMGSLSDYVSQFEISDLYSQINYQGAPVRVSPLGYADIFKWLTNREDGIPAYVIVNMTTQETEVVRPEEGMKYTQSEPLARNIDRYVQLKYPFYMFEELSFEIDEDGHPWWVCPVQTRTIGLFGGEDISRVVLVDACSGECFDYAIEDCPQWVDRAYPSELLIEQYNWSGKYINGWWNSWIGQEGVKQTTPGSNGQLGYNYIAKDDDVWVYTGVTSATADNSIIGFVLVNQRTAESHFYSVAGATETSAMSSAEGQVQNLGYSATFPLLINVSGQPTYFMALKDDAGLVKKYAMLDIQRYQSVAVGDTVSDTQKSYKSLLATNGALTGSVVDTTSETVTGKIARVATAVVDGNSHFYVTLEGDSRIFDCPLPTIIGIVAYGEGDTVTLDYLEGDPTCTVTELVAGAAADSTTGTTTTGTTTTSTGGTATTEGTATSTTSAGTTTTSGAQATSAS